jgi:hypothetical protein
MLKKTIIAGLLVGFIGILVWGGVNRTLAKTSDSSGGNANSQAAAGNGTQQRGYGNQGKNSEEECDEEGPYGNVNGQTDTSAQEQSNGNGPSSEDDTGNSYGVADDHQTQGQAQGNGNRGGRGNGNGAGQGAGYDPITATEIEALNMALDDEYHALVVYQSVIAKFGEVEPFVEIAASEQRHIDALVNQFNKHGLSVPENTWIGNVPIFDSLQQACQAGVEAEIANADLYNQLFSMTDDPSLTRVFTNLSNASWISHLPQFEACQ